MILMNDLLHLAALVAGDLVFFKWFWEKTYPKKSTAKKAQHFKYQMMESFVGVWGFCLT